MNLDMFLTNQPINPAYQSAYSKLTVTQLVKKYPVIYGTRKFVSVSTKTRHWTPS